MAAAAPHNHVLLAAISCLADLPSPILSTEPTISGDASFTFAPPSLQICSDEPPSPNLLIPLDPLHSDADCMMSWLDSLPPIVNSDALNDLSDMFYSTASLSFRRSDQEFETTETPDFGDSQSAVDDAVDSGSLARDKAKELEAIKVASPESVKSRKRRRFPDPSEARYLIVTQSDQELLDDGFKWRKYGQKSVKDSMFPRSYYRCANAGGGCQAVKHVERSSWDESLVLTTYQGRHVHPGLSSATKARPSKQKLNSMTESYGFRQDLLPSPAQIFDSF